MSKPIPAALLAQYNRDGIPIDYDSTSVLERIAVTVKNGATAYQLPNGAARQVKNYGFGETLEVIEDREDWYGVQDRISREYDDNNDGIIDRKTFNWEKVFVKKDKTGAMFITNLTPEELNIITYSSASGKDKYFETGKALNNSLKIERIDKDLFEKKRSIAVDFLSKNDRGIKKRDGVLSMPTVKQVVKFVDKDNGNDGDAKFEYIGQIDFLNQYLVNGNYWESADYKMIDKVTGETMQSFIDYPYISDNKQYIIAVYANPYEDHHTDLELYRIQNKKVVPVLRAGFTNWMSSTQFKDIFWAKDGYLYLTVSHSTDFWKEYTNPNDKYQYIRIKIDM